MSEFRDLLELGVSDFEPRPSGWDRLLRRASRRRTLRRVMAGVVALVVASAGTGLVLIAFRETRHPQPAATVENGKIAFSRGGPNSGIYLMNADGTGVERLTSDSGDSEPTWSPDGSRIAFVRFQGGKYDIYVMNADGSEVTRLTTDGANSVPEWSPDGTRIAFTRDVPGNQDIFVMNSDGSNVARLTDDPLLEYAPAWSPDGTRIAFSGYGFTESGPPTPVHVYAMNADGTSRVQLTRGKLDDASPAWSQDGASIAFVRDSRSVFVVGPDGSGLQEVIDPRGLTGGLGLTFYPTWSPDGTKIAFQSGPDGSDQRIYIVNVDGTGLHPVGSGRGSDPTWQRVPVGSSPESTPGMITLPDSTFLPEGALLLQTGSGPDVLHHGEAQSESLGSDLIPLDLSRDGSQILAEAGGQLVSVTLETGERSVLVRAPEGEVFGASAEWSPDGAMVAYSVGASDPAVKSTLCVFALPSRSTRCFPDAGHVYTFDWSADGSELLVVGPPAEPLHLVDMTTGHISTLVAQEGSTPINRAIAERGWGEAFQLVSPIWSPSGQYLAALANLRGSDLSYVPVIFTSAGQPVAFGRPSSEYPEPLGWSPAHDLLAYTQGEAPYRITEARILDPASGEDRMLVSSSGRDYPIVTDLVWSPSGRWLAVALWRPNGGEGSLGLRILEVTSPERSAQADIDTGGVSQPFVAWRS